MHRYVRYLNVSILVGCIAAVQVVEVVERREPWQRIDFVLQIVQDAERNGECGMAAASKGQCIVDNLHRQKCQNEVGRRPKMSVIHGGDSYLCTIQHVNVLFGLFQRVNDMAQRDCVIFDTVESCRRIETL